MVKVVNRDGKVLADLMHETEVWMGVNPDKMVFFLLHNFRQDGLVRRQHHQSLRHGRIEAKCVFGAIRVRNVLHGGKTRKPAELKNGYRYTNDHRYGYKSNGLHGKSLAVGDLEWHSQIRFLCYICI